MQAKYITDYYLGENEETKESFNCSTTGDDLMDMEVNHE
jgi:hypothetical protein